MVRMVRILLLWTDTGIVHQQSPPKESQTYAKHVLSQETSNVFTVEIPKQKIWFHFLERWIYTKPSQVPVICDLSAARTTCVHFLVTLCESSLRCNIVASGIRWFQWQRHWWKLSLTMRVHAKPIRSMGMLCLPTWMVDLYGKCR